MEIDCHTDVFPIFQISYPVFGALGLRPQKIWLENRKLRPIRNESLIHKFLLFPYDFGYIFRYILRGGAAPRQA